MTESNKIQWIYSSKDNQELQERYDQWAGDYDKDLADDFGWIGPARTAEVLARHVSTDARVLDAGAGTGLAGEALAKQGFGDIEAMDLSEGMLEVARSKGVYNAFHQAEMGNTLSLPSDHYDAVICVGTLTVGHAPPSSLDELVRVTKPGGKIVFSMRPDHYEGGGFKEKQTGLEASHKWKLLERTEEFATLPKGEPDILHEVWAYQVLA